MPVIVGEACPLRDGEAEAVRAHVPLDSLLRHGEIEGVAERVQEASDATERVTVLERFLLSRLRRGS